MHRRFGSLIAAAAFLLIGGFALPAIAAVEIGQPAPALAGPAVTGPSVDLGALRGKVVLVSFWATWCPPCRDEVPVLDAFFRQHRARGVEVIGMSIDRRRDRDEVRKFMLPYSYPAAMLNEASINGFGAPGAIPVLYVIDARGIMRARLTSEPEPLTAQRLADVVLPLLEAPPVAPQ